MKVEHQISAFEKILKSYNGQLPLHRHLFTYFKQNKHMGSSDRRWSSRYIYSFFRLGKALANLDDMQRLAIADFLCNDTPSLVVNAFLPDMAELIASPLVEKIELIKNKYAKFDLQDVFVFKAPLSQEIISEQFRQSFFIQPDLFIRIKATDSQKVINQLESNTIEVKLISPTTLALPNGTKLEQVLTDPRLYQIQDLSSQETGNYYQPKKYDYWWDCCAASGGKSLLLHDLEPNIELLVSDLRENSLRNLQERFQLAGIKKYHSKVIDLLQNNDQILHHYEFDGILLDAPCSGSGTWGRTPEMLVFFNEQKIEHYVKLQRGIAASVIPYLKPGQPLIYMTCSVFKAENEDLIEYLTTQFDVKLEKMELIKGYNRKADSMFVARLIKAH